MILDSVRISFVYKGLEARELGEAVSQAKQAAREMYVGDWQVEDVETVGDDLVEVTLAAGGETGYILTRTRNLEGVAMCLLEDLGYVVGSPGYNEYYSAVLQHLQALAAGEEVDCESLFA